MRCKLVLAPLSGPAMPCDDMIKGLTQRALVPVISLLGSRPGSITPSLWILRGGETTYKPTSLAPLDTWAPAMTQPRSQELTGAKASVSKPSRYDVHLLIWSHGAARHQTNAEVLPLSANIHSRSGYLLRSARRDSKCEHAPGRKLNGSHRN